MHVKVEGKALREALSKAGPVTTRAAGYTGEMYSSAKLEADADTVTITVTNSELQIKQRIPAAELIKPGTLLIPREQLIRVAKEAETIEIEEKKSQIHILAAGTTFRLNKPAVEPPERESAKEAKSVFMRGGELRQLLKHTRSFVSRDSSRMSLNGILLERRPREIRAAATDGHKLSLSTLAQPNGNEALRVVIPPEVAQLILGIANDEEDVEIRIGENTIGASGPKYEILGALLQEKFPDYEKVIPAKNPHAVKTERKKLLESLQRLKTIADQTHCGLKLSFGRGELKLDIQNPNIGEATETLEIEGGEKVPEIGMNVGYLIDAMETIGEESVKIEINDGTSPALLTGESRNPLIVIMPMRL